MQSPLRAGILRFLSARPDESFDIEALMQTFGRMRLDVDNCVRELVEFGVVRKIAGDPAKFIAARPEHEPVARLLDNFLERRAHVGIEDTSPSVQRFREMIGRDEKMLAIFEWIRTSAKSDISVLILGPTGSGKELVARMIHELSRRGTEKFQAVNCAALPDTLFESEIFGYEKGAFTGAHDRKPGRLELANGGTLFLDEIGDLSLVAQAKLLRVLEERRFERLGGNKSISVDFRLISATNRPLDLFVRESRFREDLYYRINAFAIRLPSLRSARSTSRCWPIASSRATARRTACRSTPSSSRARRWTCWAPITGPATSASSKARCRARRCRRRPRHPRRRHRVPARPRRRGRRKNRATVCPSLRDAERAHIIRVLEAVELEQARSGARCSTSAAARSTARSRNTASSRPARRARRRARRDSALVAVDCTLGCRPQRRIVGHDESCSSASPGTHCDTQLRSALTTRTLVLMCQLTSCL